MSHELGRLVSTAVIVAIAVAVSRGPNSRVVIALPAAPAPAPLQIPIVLPVPVVIGAPPAAPAPAARASCPTPVRDAPRLGRDGLPTDVAHVRAAHANARWIAAWNDVAVWITRDGGKRWSRVLDGSGAARDVAFDCFGRAIVWRDQIGVADESGGERWRVAPDVGTQNGRLVGDGPDVVVLGTQAGDGLMARFAISSDLGASWRDRDVDAQLEHASGRQHADGAIRVALTTSDCDAIGPGHSTTRVIERGGEVTTARYNPDGYVSLFDDIEIDSQGGWRRDKGAWRTFDFPRDDVFILARNAELPRAVVNGKVYALDGGRMRRLGTWPYDQLSPNAVDAAGRLWAIVDEGGERVRLHVVDLR
jgi:hypothetical protein